MQHFSCKLTIVQFISILQLHLPHSRVYYNQTLTHSKIDLKEKKNLQRTLSSSWSLRTTLQSSASSRTETSLLTDRRLEQLAVWCSLNNLELNTLKTVEKIVDFRRNPLALHPLTIMDSTVAAVETFNFWEPPSLRTWSGKITLTLLWKRPSRGCISSAS